TGPGGPRTCALSKQNGGGSGGAIAKTVFTQEAAGEIQAAKAKFVLYVIAAWFGVARRRLCVVKILGTYQPVAMSFRAPFRPHFWYLSYARAARSRICSLLSPAIHPSRA